MKKLLLLMLVPVLLAGCRGGEAANSPIPESELSPPVAPVGDACEYAKSSFVRAHQRYEEDPSALLLEKQREARKAMEAICNAGKEEGGTWACAEGHSCR